MFKIEKIDSQNYWLYKKLQITVEQVKMMGDNSEEPCTFYLMNVMSQYAFESDDYFVADVLAYRNTLLGFSNDNIPVGFCSYCYMNTDINNLGFENYGYFITSYMIDKNFQLRNFGTYGMKLLIEYIKQNHIPEKIYIAVDPANIPAKNLFLKSGFVLDEYSKKNENNHNINLNMFLDCL